MNQQPGVQPTRRSVGIWIEQAGTSVPIAAAELKERAAASGLFGMSSPIRAKLPTGLTVEVSCERIATGHFHVGISHNDRLYSMGKYEGTFDVRVFPENHSSYVVSVKWET